MAGACIFRMDACGKSFVPARWGRVLRRYSARQHASVRPARESLLRSASLDLVAERPTLFQGAIVSPPTMTLNH